MCCKKLTGVFAKLKSQKLMEAEIWSAFNTNLTANCMWGSSLLGSVFVEESEMPSGFSRYKKQQGTNWFS